MSLAVFALTVMGLLTAGYLLYGSFIARQYRLDDSRSTPAVAVNDGVDFTPTAPFYLMSQHFSAIAAAGPIVGPVAACMAFGWLPCVLWIVLGVVFIGAVHDFSALVASVRHGARSIAEIAKLYLGRRAYLSLAAFIWLSLLYVIVAFTDVTAQSFVGSGEEVEGMRGPFNRGGAVAAASVMYLVLALVMGLFERRLKPSTWVSTLIFVPATLFVIWLATHISTALVLPASTWYFAILAYCLVASLLPLWLLQQPRGYLGGFVLYLALAIGVIGLFFGGFTVRQPQFREQTGGLGDWLSGAQNAPPMTSLLFPFLFVTIACGACSGFHGLVCSGTTSKQIARESHCKPIGFGCMLLEGFVAVIALSTVMILTPEEAGKIKNPGVIYGEGIARFLTVLLGKDALLFAKTFGTMAVATFIFDTLDVATRLGRYLLQEITGAKSRAGGFLAALATSAIPLVILTQAPADSWKKFWTLFGTSNQLLAALTLLSITVWLRRTGKKYWYTLLPALFVGTATLTALGAQTVAGWRVWRKDGFSSDPAVVNACVGLALLTLAVFYIVEAAHALRPGPVADAAAV